MDGNVIYSILGKSRISKDLTMEDVCKIILEKDERR